MHRSHLVRPLGFSLVLALAACSESPSSPGRQPAPLTALPRNLTASELTVRDASNVFAFAWWSRLNAAQPDANLFVSPLSASFALGMTLNGAAGATLDQMRDALQLPDVPVTQLNEGYRSLLALLTSLDPAVTARIANSIWYRQDFPFHEAFLATMRAQFDAEVSGLDFANEAASLSAINGWVSAKTSGRIPSIVDRINDNSVMFLINAIYFNGNWRQRFDAARTTNEDFRRRDGGTQSVRMMNRTDTVSYAESDTWQAVDLPYGNTAFTMTVVLPAEGLDVSAFAGSLTPASWSAIVSALAPQKVMLSLPKLKLSYERTLNDDLKSLGMQIPFDAGNADFTGMSVAGRDLFISNVKQKAYVDIHEEGTEAAAATSVEMGVTSAPIIPIVRVDRPYLFVLRERLSGTILFMGKVVAVPAS